MHHILVIDDEREISELLQQGLRRFGYQVKTAGGGREGLRLFSDGIFDLVITDILMPDTDGHAVARQIRNSDRPHTPIIAISGAEWPLNGDKFDCVLSKPFSLRTLANAVENVLRHALSLPREFHVEGMGA